MDPHELLKEMFEIVPRRRLLPFVSAAAPSTLDTQVDDDRGGLITVHELHQTIREIGQELSIDDVRFSSVV